MQGMRVPSSDRHKGPDGIQRVDFFEWNHVKRSASQVEPQRGEHSLVFLRKCCPIRCPARSNFNLNFHPDIAKSGQDHRGRRRGPRKVPS